MDISVGWLLFAIRSFLSPLFGVRKPDIMGNSKRDKASVPNRDSAIAALAALGKP
jgi:hypothetical protein